MQTASILQSFHQHFGEAPALLVRAPGRINLIGEHTDYNEGFVLPAAIDRAIYFAISPRQDGRLEFVAADLNDTFSAQNGNPGKSAKAWPNYLLGIYHELQNDGRLPGGINLVFGGDIPVGAGLSSSAALESGLLFALNELFALDLSRTQMARIAQRSENNFVGLRCGIMDMFTSLMGRQHHAIKLDCRSLEHHYIPFNDSQYAFVLCDSHVKHSLASSDFNTRRAECEEGVRILKAVYPDIKSLRDLTLEMLLDEKKLLPHVIFDRCHYVIKENARLENACMALQKGDFGAFGALMYETDRGLDIEYNVSCPEIRFLVSATRTLDFCIGARMMGGGFGGCTLNLVPREAVAHFIEYMQAKYLEFNQTHMPCWEVQLTNGVELLPTD